MSGESDPRFPTARAVLRGSAIATVLLVAIRLAEPFVGGPDGFSAMAFHPFWIVVVLCAAQGGLYTGIVAACLATALMGWPERAVGSDILAHYAQATTIPALWILTALVLGSYRQAQIAIEDGLRAANADLHADNATLAAEIERLDAAVDRMELTALTRRSVGDRAIAALADLGRSEPATRPDAVATAAALLTRQPGYVLRHGRPDPVWHWGFPEGYAPRDGGVSDDGRPRRAIAGYGHAARQPFAGGEVVILADTVDAAEAERAAAVVLSHAIERSLRDERPARHLVKAIG